MGCGVCPCPLDALHVYTEKACTTGLVFLVPLFVQCHLLQFQNNTTARVIRLALTPVSILLCFNYAAHVFEPFDLYVIPNFAVIGIFAGYGVMKALEWGFASSSEYVYAHPTSSRLAWTMEHFCNMRGRGWSWSQVKLPPPLRPFLPQVLLRIVYFHLLSLVVMTLILQAQDVGSTSALLSHWGLTLPPRLAFLATVIDTLLFGSCAWIGIELGYALHAFNVYILHQSAYALRLTTSAFDPADWPPLMRNPWMMTSLRDFWSHRWHSLFVVCCFIWPAQKGPHAKCFLQRPFTFLGFRPLRRVGTALKSRTLGYALGVCGAFLVSGLFHEMGFYAATRHRDAKVAWTTTFFFLVQSVGVIAEVVFEKISHRKVSGWLGRLWALSFLIYTGTFLAKHWMMDGGLSKGLPPVRYWKPARFIVRKWLPHFKAMCGKTHVAALSVPVFDIERARTVVVGWGAWQCPIGSSPALPQAHLNQPPSAEPPRRTETTCLGEGKRLYRNIAVSASPNRPIVSDSFKKQLARAGTQVMQKTGQIDKTDDRDFQEEVQKFKSLEKNASALQKEAKAYLDAMRMMAAAQARIGETVDNFYGDNSEDAMTAHAYRRAVEELDNRVAQDLDAPFRATVLEPIGRLCSHFPEINTTITKRNKKLLDYDAARSKVRKLHEKPSSDDGIKIPRAEKEYEEAQAIYEAINSAISKELPELVALRIPYLEPSFEALVRMQTRFAEESYERLGGIQRYLPEQVRDEYAQGTLDTKVENAIAEMRELSICGM